MLIVDDIINLVYLAVFERNFELILYLHAVDCFQGLYWNGLFVWLCAGNVTSGQNVLCTSTEYLLHTFFCVAWNVEVISVFHTCHSDSGPIL